MLCDSGVFDRDQEGEVRVAAARPLGLERIGDEAQTVESLKLSPGSVELASERLHCSKSEG